MKRKTNFSDVNFILGMTAVIGLPLYFGWLLGAMSLQSAALWHLAVTAIYWLFVLVFSVSSSLEFALPPLILAVIISVLTPVFHQAQQRRTQQQYPQAHSVPKQGN